VSERLDHAHQQFIVPLSRGTHAKQKDDDDVMLIGKRPPAAAAAATDDVVYDVDAGDRELDDMSGKVRRPRGESRLKERLATSMSTVMGSGAPVAPIDGAEAAEAARGSLTLVVDGPSLEFILADAVLSNNFLTIGRRCRSVLCCRVSPLQKSLVVKLARLGLKARCLAIGDGANDVSMIQAAQVGVGISGNEGMQAVMAADFAIAQFRFLQDLLLVHGRNNYRRLCKLILYSFYKNFVFVLVQFWYGADSAWSAENLYDAYVMAGFNLIFTALPLLCMGIFDRDVSRKTALLFPQLYETGRLSHDFSGMHLLLRLLSGLYGSLVCWFLTREALLHEVLSHAGLVADQWMLGFITFQCVFFTATGSIMIDFRLWNWTHFAALGISFLLFFVLLIIYGELYVAPYHMYKLPLASFALPMMWLCTLVVPVVALLPEFVCAYLQWQFFPRNDQILAEVERTGRELDADEVSRINLQVSNRNVPLQIKTLKYVRRGFERTFALPPKVDMYATPDTLSDVDVLRRLNLFNPLVAPPPKSKRRRLKSLFSAAKPKATKAAKKKEAVS